MRIDKTFYSTMAMTTALQHSIVGCDNKTGEKRKRTGKTIIFFAAWIVLKNKSTQMV